jgi:hypothetical protein
VSDAGVTCFFEQSDNRAFEFGSAEYLIRSGESMQSIFDSQSHIACLSSFIAASCGVEGVDKS